jgi:hypothetical protein
MEKKEYEMADNITKSIVEIWNENNPTRKLNGDLLPLIKDHIRYAYVAGWEDLRRDIKHILMSRDSEKIDRYFFIAKVDFLELKS